MQKVVGSSPIIRSTEPAGNGGFCRCPSCKRFASQGGWDNNLLEGLFDRDDLDDANVRRCGKEIVGDLAERGRNFAVEV